MITQNHIKSIEFLLASERVDLNDVTIDGKVFFSIGGNVDKEELDRIHKECDRSLTEELLKRKAP